MERLTKRSENGTAIYNTPSSNPVKWENNRHEVLQKLAEYEDLEEQGKLLKLPCAVGDGAFRINKGARKPIIQMEIIEISLFNVGVDKMSTQIKCRDYTYGGVLCYMLGDIGKIVFLTESEATIALQELNKESEGKNEQGRIIENRPADSV